MKYFLYDRSAIIHRIDHSDACKRAATKLFVASTGDEEKDFPGVEAAKVDEPPAMDVDLQQFGDKLSEKGKIVSVQQKLLFDATSALATMRISSEQSLS